MTFSKELVDAIVKYLMSRPWAEVNVILERMNQEAEPQLKAQQPVAPETVNETQAQEVKAS